MREMLVYDKSGHIVYEIYKYFGIFYDISSAKSKKEALSKLNFNRFDVLLINLNNINSNGFGILQELHHEIERPRVIIAISGCLQQFEIIYSTAIELGADDCIAEPVNPKLLLIKIEKMLIDAARKNNLI